MSARHRLTQAGKTCIDLDTAVSDHLATKLRLLREQTVAGPTVRILFCHETQLARADEILGGFVVEPLTYGRWEDLNDVEITARLYSWARELPVSRLDVP